MNDYDRIIGSLQAHQEYTRERFDKLEKKVDDLWVFRWKIAGASMATAAIISILISAAGVFAQRVPSILRLSNSRQVTPSYSAKLSHLARSSSEIPVLAAASVIHLYCPCGDEDPEIQLAKF